MQNSTLRSILRIGATTLLAGGINYLYHPAMLQFMSIETFGEFTAILGIFNILGVLTTGIGLFLVQKIAQQHSDLEQVGQIFCWSVPRSAGLGAVAFVLFLLLTPLIKEYLHLQSYFPLILVGLTILISFFSTPFSSLVQGIQDFTFLGVNSILGACFKFALGVGFAALGRGIYAAVGGLIGGGILSLLVLAWWSLSRILQPQKFKSAKTNVQLLDQTLFKEIKNLISMLVMVFLLSLFMNADVILVRNLFDAKSAGIYGGVAVIGKFIIFLAAAIETVYYPKIIQAQTLDQVPSPWLKNPFLLLCIGTLGAIAGTALFGPYVLGLMKPELADQNFLLILVVMMCSCYGFISLYAKVLIAFKDYWTNWILGLLGLVLVLMLYVFPALTLMSYVLMIAGVESLIIVLLLSRLYFLRKSHV